MYLVKEKKRNVIHRDDRVQERKRRMKTIVVLKRDDFRERKREERERER